MASQRAMEDALRAARGLDRTGSMSARSSPAVTREKSGSLSASSSPAMRKKPVDLKSVWNLEGNWANDVSSVEKESPREPEKKNVRDKTVENSSSGRSIRNRKFNTLEKVLQSHLLEEKKPEKSQEINTSFLSKHLAKQPSLRRVEKKESADEDTSKPKVDSPRTEITGPEDVTRTGGVSDLLSKHLPKKEKKERKEPCIVDIPAEEVSMIEQKSKRENNKFTSPRPSDGTLKANSVGANVRVLWRTKEYIRLHYAAIHVPWSRIRVLRDKANEKRGPGESMMMSIELASLRRENGTPLFPEDFESLFGDLFITSFIPLVHEKFNQKGELSSSLLPSDIAQAFRLLVLAERLDATLLEDVYNHLHQLIRDTTDACSPVPATKSAAYQIIHTSLQMFDDSASQGSMQESIISEAIDGLIHQLPDSLQALEDLVRKSSELRRADMSVKLFRASTRHALCSTVERYNKQVIQRGEQFFNELEHTLNVEGRKESQLDLFATFLSGMSHSLRKDIETTMISKSQAIAGAGFAQGILLHKVGMGSYGGPRIVRIDNERIRWKKPGKYRENKGLERVHIVAISAVENDSLKKTFRISSSKHGLVTFRAESEEIRDQCVVALQRWWRNRDFTFTSPSVARAKRTGSVDSLHVKLAAGNTGDSFKSNSSTDNWSDSEDEEQLLDTVGANPEPLQHTERDRRERNENSNEDNRTRPQATSSLAKHTEKVPALPFSPKEQQQQQQQHKPNDPRQRPARPARRQSKTDVKEDVRILTLKAEGSEAVSSSKNQVHSETVCEREGPIQSVLADEAPTIDNDESQETGPLMMPPPPDLVCKQKAKENSGKSSSFKRWKFLSSTLKLSKSDRSPVTSFLSKESSSSDSEVNDSPMEQTEPPVLQPLPNRSAML